MPSGSQSDTGFYVLSAEDRDWLKSLVQEKVNEVISTRNRFNYNTIEDAEQPTPEMYVAFSATGISASTVGTGSAIQTGIPYADCGVYRLIQSGSSYNLHPLARPLSTNVRRVFNLSGSAISPGYFQVVRDKLKSWWAIPKSTGGGGGGTITVEDSSGGQVVTGVSTLQLGPPASWQITNPSAGIAKALVGVPNRVVLHGCLGHAPLVDGIIPPLQMLFGDGDDFGWDTDSYFQLIGGQNVIKVPSSLYGYYLLNGTLFFSSSGTSPASYNVYAVDPDTWAVTAITPTGGATYAAGFAWVIPVLSDLQSVIQLVGSPLGGSSGVVQFQFTMLDPPLTPSFS